MKLFSFLFKQKTTGQKSFLEIARAIRILADKKEKAVLVVDGDLLSLNHGDLDQTGDRITAQNIIEKVVTDNEKYLSISSKTIKGIKFQLPFPTKVYHQNLTNSQLACLGVSQETDNIAVAISEDGQISIAYQNSIRTDISYPRLEAILDFFFEKNSISETPNLIVKKV
jgi:hypothetical protein